MQRIIEVELSGHHEKEPVADMLRLFFEDVRATESADGGTRLTATDPGADDTATAPIRLTVGVSPQVEREAVRAVMREQAPEPDTEYAVSVSSVNGSRERRTSLGKLRETIKLFLYEYFSEMLDVQFPWGSLTGIRPTQIAEREQLVDPETAKDRLTGYWKVRGDKADLALWTTRHERRLLNRVPRNAPMMYMGIPFCPGRCAYCSFISRDANRQGDRLAEYMKALEKEIILTAERMLEKNLKISALYLGGGTPTSPSDDQFAHWLAVIDEHIDLLPDAEITIEAGRPDTINRAKLAAIKQHFPEARICINPQTMNDATLERIGRRHTVKQTVDAFKLSRESGFASINMDLILGLPGETVPEFEHSLEAIIALKPESITLHTLSLKRAARLNETAARKYRALRYPDPEWDAAMTWAQQRLQELNYFPYYLYRQKNQRAGLENVGYTLAGHECVYNVGMMSDEVSVIGLGAGASSKAVFGKRVERSHNSKDLLDYSARIEEMIDKKIRLFEGKY